METVQDMCEVHPLVGTMSLAVYTLPTVYVLDIKGAVPRRYPTIDGVIQGCGITTEPDCNPLAMICKFCPTSPTDCHRLSGSFAKHVFTNGSRAGGDIACNDDIAGGSRSRIAAIKLA